ncbi:hypothetical protein BH10PSE2_BH10PSE2_22950 [soil metagenome]
MLQFRSLVALATGASLVVACSRQQPAVPAQPVQSVPAAPSAPPATPVGYACESGKTVTVRYPETATAQLAYLNQTYALRTVPAASGARYSGWGLEWLTVTQNGQESATLSRLGPDADVGAAVLERCTRPTTAADSPMSSAPTGPVAPPVPIPNPGPDGLLPVSLPCKSNQLKLSADGGDAGMGHRLTTLGVQNTGPQACRVTGYPTVILLDGRGRTLTTIRTDQHPGSYLRSGAAPTPVNLAPQAKGYFDLAWTVVPNEGNGETVCPSAVTMRFTAPGDSNFSTFAQAFTPCGGRIEVSPIRPTMDDVPPTT